MKILKDNQGNVLVKNGAALSVPGTSPDLEFPTYTGTVDAEGLAELGWDEEDIAWLQAHVWWNAEDNEYWKVTEANKAFGPNGATPLTWANKHEQKQNQYLRYFPKLNMSPAVYSSWASTLSNFRFVVAIPTHGWDTTNVTNLNSMFTGGYSLRSVGDLSAWNTSRVTSLSSMFSYCYLLLSVGDLSFWDTSSVTGMSYMFCNCRELRNIGDLSHWDVSQCTTFQSAFSGCSSLISLGDISDWDTSKVTRFDGAFAGCSVLSNIGKLSRWDTSNVTKMNNMFNGCSHLTALDLSQWNTSKVDNMAGMFTSCYALASIGDISGWDMSKVTNCDSMFAGCFYLKYLGDLSNWDFSSIISCSAIFQNCYSLSNIQVSNWRVSSLENINNMFTACYNIGELDLSEWTLTSCSVAGTAVSNSPFYNMYSLMVLKLGPHFFDGTFSTLYTTSVTCWTRDSIYESLYTNQTLRNTSSTAITVRLAAEAYDRLSQQDKDDIATKNITLMRG